MNPEKPLLLHQELTLLALRDEEGTFQIGPGYDYAVGGAILAELLLNRRITVDDSKKTKYAKLLSSKPLGDRLIDECLQRLAQSPRRASLQTWVSRFAHVKKLRVRIGEQLCQRGILRADQDKILWLFTRKVYPEVDPVPERRLIARMRRALCSEAQTVDPRTVVLISLAKSADLLKAVFDRKTLQQRKARIEQIVRGEVAGSAAREAVEALQAAIFVTCILPAVTYTTSIR